MKKVLIIGASGSLGSGISAQLRDRYALTGTFLSNRLDIDGIEIKRLDITEKSEFKSLAGDYDVVILLSGAMPATMAGYDPYRYIDVNVKGTLNVLEYCRKCNIKKLIYIMTFSDVSGSFYNGIPIKHDDPRTLTFTGDHAVYAISKVAACDLVEHYHQQHGTQTIILRIPTVYCHDNNVNYYVEGVLRTKAYVQMIRSVVNYGSIEVWGNPENAKDMPYIKDFVGLIELVVESETAQGIFNAGTGRPVTLARFVDSIIEVFGEGRNIKKFFKPDKPSQPNFTFDMSHTVAEFGWHPKYNVAMMLEDIKKETDASVWIEGRN